MSEVLVSVLCTLHCVVSDFSVLRFLGFLEELCQWSFFLIDEEHKFSFGVETLEIDDDETKECVCSDEI